MSVRLSRPQSLISEIEKAKVDGERKAVGADLGPVRYLATLLGTSDETTMRWFILVVALLLDPAAILLNRCLCHPLGTPQV